MDPELCEAQNFSLPLLQQILPVGWFALLDFPPMNFKFLCVGKSKLVLNLGKFCHILFSLACYQLTVNMLSLIMGANSSTMHVQNHHIKCFKSKQGKRPRWLTDMTHCQQCSQSHSLSLKRIQVFFVGEGLAWLVGSWKLQIHACQPWALLC